MKELGMKNKNLFLLLCSVILFTGCYTIMRHKKVDRETYLSSEITHRDICSDCHAGYGTFTMEDPYALKEPYNSPSLKKWNDYYHYPWWADSFYYSDKKKGEDGERLSPIDPRTLRNRKGLDSPGMNAAPAPAGTGIRMLTKSTAADSTKSTEKKVVPEKPSTDKEKLQSKKPKRTKKKN